MDGDIGSSNGGKKIYGKDLTSNVKEGTVETHKELEQSFGVDGGFGFLFSFTGAQIWFSKSNELIPKALDGVVVCGVGYGAWFEISKVTVEVIEAGMITLTETVVQINPNVR